MSNPNETLVEKYGRIMSRFATITLAEASELIADDCIIHESDALPIRGKWKGPQGMVDLMQAVQRTFPNFTFEMGDFLSNNSDMIAFSGRIAGDCPHGRFSTRLIEFWTFRDGKAVDILPCWHDVKLVADLYYGPGGKA